MNTPSHQVPNLDYTRLITCVLYEGGSVPVLEMLHKRGINEAYFYSVRGAPMGRSSEVSGLPEIPKTEILHAVVSADQSDYIYDMTELDQPNRGVVYVNRLARSTPFELPDEATLAAA